MLAEIRVNVFAGLFSDTIYKVEAGTLLTRWMHQNYPQGFGRPAVCFINGNMVPLDKLLSVKVEGGDQIEFVAPPADITGAMIAKFIISALVSTALSMIAGALVKKPKPPAALSQTTPAADPVYSVVRPNNQPRIGEPIPVIYGEVITTPDLASQPYVFYRNNEQYLHEILCVGAGDVDVKDLLFGDTPASSLESHAVQYWVYKPAQHGSAMGKIEADHSIMEDVVTSPEVAGVELNGGKWHQSSTVDYVMPLTFTAPDEIRGFTGTIAAGQHFTITGSASNNAAFVVHSFVGGVITTKEKTIVTEAPRPPQSGTFAVTNYWCDFDGDKGPTDHIYVDTPDDLHTKIAAGADVTGTLESPYGPHPAINFKVTQVTKITGTIWRIDFDQSHTAYADERNKGSVTGGSLAYTGSPSSVSPKMTITTDDTPYTSSWFITSRPQAYGNKLFIDLVLPAGLYVVDGAGNFVATNIKFEIQYQAVDDSGAPYGSVMINENEYRTMTTTPQRYTIGIDVPLARYRVRVVRLTPPPAERVHGSTLVWEALKMRLEKTSGTVYGNVTLVAVEVRSTNGISSSASSAIRAICYRNLKPAGTRALVSGMRHANPADVVYDVLTDQSYGARRPASEYDLAEFNRMRGHWGDYGRFNAVFSTRTTVWEAIVSALQPVAAAPLPMGNLMSLVQDGKKLARTYVFTDSNIVRGTLKIRYAFSKNGAHDGVTVEYRNPSTFSAEYVTFPSTALDPEKVTLFGCVDKDIAYGHAKLIRRKELRLRKSVSFDTELDGFIPNIGDRIGVSVSLPKWGVSGSVISAAGADVTLDAAMDWTGTGHVVVFMLDDGTPTAAIPVTKGADDHIVTLGTPQTGIHGHTTSDATRYAFGTAAKMMADFVVTEVQHSGPVTVAVNAVNYDEAIYADTIPFLEVAI